MRIATPGTAAVEEVAGVWLLDLLGLPPGSDVGYTTGATMANFTGLAAARHHLLDRAGWDDLTLGLTGAPRIRVLAGAERHESPDRAALSRPRGAHRHPGDEQGRVRADEMRSQLAEDAGPAIVCLRVAALVDRLVENAQALAAGISQIDGTEVLMTSSIPRFAWHSGMTPGPRPWPAS
jgi:hypothetical protein